MRVLITFFSQTGKTRMVAEAIREELGEIAELKELSDTEGLEGYDLAFIGFPIMAFGPAQPAREFLERHAAGRKVALFVTHAAPDDEPALQDWLENCRAAASGAQLAGFFHCQGELSQAVADALLASDNPDLRGFGERRSETLGQPDEDALRRARSFAREVIEGL